MHLFPAADIPVSVLTLDIHKNFSEHLEVAKTLKNLNNPETLIFASGNIVHNLSRLSGFDFERENAYDWAKNVNEYAKENFLHHNLDALVNLPKNTDFSLAIPTPEHYLPFLYIAGATEKNENIQVFNDAIVA